MKLRRYQVECASLTQQELQKGTSTMLDVLPTGCGKTVIFCMLAWEWVLRGNGRVMVICPTIDLVKQAARKLEQITSSKVAIEQAKHWSNEAPMARADYVCACKPSLLTENSGTEEPRYQRFEDITLVIVDEAHLSITKKFSDMLDWFVGNGAQVVGFTATPERSDKKSLANVYKANPYTMGIVEGIEQGWLVGCKTHSVTLQSLDLTNVNTTGEDFVQRELGPVMEDEEVCFEIASVTAKEMECQD